MFALEESSDDDDFDPGRCRPHSNRYNNAFEESPQHPYQQPNPNTTRTMPMPSSTTPVTVLSHSPQQQQQPHPQGVQSSAQNELLLSPQGLILWE